MNFFEKHAHKIEPAPDGCWHWSGSADRYGFVMYGGKVWNAHRAAFDAANGPGSAAGWVIRHKCDQPLCVNPHHLVAGTYADNTRDMMERGRWGGRTPPPRPGAAAHQAKLTDDAVREIRRRYRPRDPKHSFNAMGREFGVDPGAVRYAYLGKTWRHV